MGYPHLIENHAVEKFFIDFFIKNFPFTKSSEVRNDLFEFSFSFKKKFSQKFFDQKKIKLFLVSKDPKKIHEILNKQKITPLEFSYSFTFADVQTPDNKTNIKMTKNTV